MPPLPPLPAPVLAMLSLLTPLGTIDGVWVIAWCVYCSKHTPCTASQVKCAGWWVIPWC